MHTSAQGRPQRKLSAEHCHGNKKMVQCWRFTTRPVATEVWRHGRLVWARRARKAHFVPAVQQAMIHQLEPLESQKNEQRWIVGTRWAGCSRDHCFSELQCCSLWCHWNVQSAEFLMRSGQKYNTSCPYSELISCFSLCREPSSAFISF